MKIMTMFENSTGITVRDLKKMIETWPETNDMGEPCEVWIETGRGLSSQAMRGCALNVRKNDDGEYSADLLLESDAFEDEKNDDVATATAKNIARLFFLWAKDLNGIDEEKRQNGTKGEV